MQAPAGDISTADAAQSKKKGSSSSKKVAEPRVVIAKIQRQKRKFITAIAGLESVPGIFALFNIFTFIKTFF